MYRSAAFGRHSVKTLSIIEEQYTMTTQQPTQCAGDKTRQALTELAELLLKDPDKNRETLLQQVEIKYDLTPKECEFLNRNFRK